MSCQKAAADSRPAGWWVEAADRIEVVKVKMSGTYRGAVAGAALAGATLLAAGCGNSGVTLQGAPSDPPSSASRPVGTPTPTATPITTGFGSTQPAVDVVVAMFAAYNKATRAPVTSTSTSFDQYLVGQAKSVFDSAFAAGKTKGLAADGTPAELRISVTSTTTGPGGTNFAVLTNCPLISASNPAGAYDIKTGQHQVGTPVPGSVPQPWPQTVKLFQANGAGPWKITYFASDASKTCKA